MRGIVRFLMAGLFVGLPSYAKALDNPSKQVVRFRPLAAMYQLWKIHNDLDYLKVNLATRYGGFLTLGAKMLHRNKQTTFLPVTEGHAMRKIGSLKVMRSDIDRFWNQVHAPNKSPRIDQQSNSPNTVAELLPPPHVLQLLSGQLRGARTSFEQKITAIERTGMKVLEKDLKACKTALREATEALRFFEFGCQRAIRAYSGQ